MEINRMFEYIIPEGMKENLKNFKHTIYCLISGPYPRMQGMLVLIYVIGNDTILILVNLVSDKSLVTHHVEKPWFKFGLVHSFLHKEMAR